MDDQFKKPITKVEENHCMGEPCLVVYYGEMLKRTVALYSEADLKRSIEALRLAINKDKTEKAVKIDLDKGQVNFSSTNQAMRIEAVNEHHSKRLKDILENAMVYGKK